MALAHEAKAVNDVKRQHRFTVVIGNPPYSKLSGNWNEWIDSLLHGRGSDAAAAPDYYQVDGAGLGERTVWIQDDYIKFTRLSQWQIDRSGNGEPRKRLSRNSHSLLSRNLDARLVRSYGVRLLEPKLQSHNSQCGVWGSSSLTP